MNRSTSITGLLAAFLALAAAASAAGPAEDASPGEPTEKVSAGEPTEKVSAGPPTRLVLPITPTQKVSPGEPTEKMPTAVPVMGVIETVDAEKRTVQVKLTPPRQGKTSETVLVPPDARIYRQTDVASADIAVGDIIEVQSIPPRLFELLAESAEISFPPRLLAATADVIALDPLTLGAGDDIAITLKDPNGLRFRRWQPLELADVSTGDRIAAIGQQGETGLTSRWIRISPAPPRPVMQPVRPEPPE